MIKIIAIKKLGNLEVPKVACQAAYGDSCHPVTDMGRYGMLEVSQKKVLKNQKGLSK